MLSLVEKVLVLKSASLFNQTPDNVLADVAQRVQEISFEAGDLIFNKGDFGDSLYIIVSGTVQVWDGPHLLNELGEGDIFGELALLDPAAAFGIHKIDRAHSSVAARCGALPYHPGGAGRRCPSRSSACSPAIYATTCVSPKT